MTRDAERPLAGKRALVCGASRGIGRACALELARLGAAVTACARDADRLRAVREAIDSAAPAPEGDPHRTLVADFAQPQEVKERIAAHLAAVGETQILVHCGGGPPGGPILAAAEEAFRSAFDQHLICGQLLVQLLVPGMTRAAFGRVINIVSTSVKQPIRGLGVSNTIRAAVASWAKTLSVELAPHGITVNNVLPGATDTDRLREIIRKRADQAGKPEAAIEDEMIREIPAGRFARPEEIASVVGFLATPAAGYVTGVSLPVDGGRTLAL